MTSLDGLILRLLSPGDSIDELTELLHLAYAPLAAAGLRYLATHQDADMTARRAAGGECWVGDFDGRLVATVTFCTAERTSGIPWYDQPGVASFQQFCVSPDLGGRGIGSQLMDLVERRARETGASEIACDTAATAEHLIAMYQARGYRIVDEISWEPVTNYPSVVLSKTLGDDA